MWGQWGHNSETCYLLIVYPGALNAVLLGQEVHQFSQHSAVGGNWCRRRLPIHSGISSLECLWIDYVVLCVEGPENHKKMLERIDHFAKDHKLEWGQAKCKVMKIGRQTDETCTIWHRHSIIHLGGRSLWWLQTNRQTNKQLPLCWDHNIYLLNSSSFSSMNIIHQ